MSENANTGPERTSLKLRRRSREQKEWARAQAEAAARAHERTLIEAKLSGTFSQRDFRQLLAHSAQDLLVSQTATKVGLNRLRDEQRLLAQKDQQRKLAKQQVRQEKDPQGIYVIGSFGGPIKIGIAANVNTRLGELQVGHPHRLRIYFQHPFDAHGRARLVERLSHARLSAERLKGEWFDVSYEVAIEAVQSVISECGMVDANED